MEMDVASRSSILDFRSQSSIAMRVIIAAGGTGGHIFPGVAIAREFKRRDPSAEILFVGTSRGLETKIVPREGFDLELISVGALKGVSVFERIKVAYGASDELRIRASHSTAIQTRRSNWSGWIFFGPDFADGGAFANTDDGG